MILTYLINCLVVLTCAAVDLNKIACSIEDQLYLPNDLNINVLASIEPAIIEFTQESIVLKTPNDKNNTQQAATPVEPSQEDKQLDVTSKTYYYNLLNIPTTQFGRCMRITDEQQNTEVICFKCRRIRDWALLALVEKIFNTQSYHGGKLHLLFDPRRELSRKAIAQNKKRAVTKIAAIPKKEPQPNKVSEVIPKPVKNPEPEKVDTLIIHLLYTSEHDFPEVILNKKNISTLLLAQIKKRQEILDAEKIFPAPSVDAENIEIAKTLQNYLHESNLRKKYDEVNDAENLTESQLLKELRQRNIKSIEDLPATILNAVKRKLEKTDIKLTIDALKVSKFINNHDSYNI